MLLQLAVSCLTGRHEIISHKDTKVLEAALLGFFRIPEDLLPFGLLIAIREERALEQDLAQAHQLFKQVGKVGRVLATKHG